MLKGTGRADVRIIRETMAGVSAYRIEAATFRNRCTDVPDMDLFDSASDACEVAKDMGFNPIN